MSRWIDGFDNHVFRPTWEDLKEKLEQSEVDITIPTQIQELARLKKVIIFLDNVLNGLDPELVPKSILDSFHQQVGPCRDHINTFNNNKNISHLKTANNHADNLLSYIRPYMIHDSKMKKTLLASVRAYTKEFEDSYSYFTKIAKDNLEIIEEYKRLSKVHEEDCLHRYEISEEAQVKITDFEAQLLGSEEVDEYVKKDIETLVSDLEEKQIKINSLFNELLVDSEEDEYVSTKTEILEANKTIQVKMNQSKELLQNVSKSTEDFNNYYEDVFGKLNAEGNREGGIKKELSDRLKHINTYETTQKSKHTALFNKIEGLLPGATTAGLATAYKDMKESFDKPIQIWNFIFGTTITIMFIATFISFSKFGYLPDSGWDYEFVKIGDLKNTFNSMLYKLPLYIPLVWLAIFASKRRSESQRLQQEYAHKEALAKSYDSYKTQIEHLEKDDQSMLLKLIESSINTISYNASVTLDGKHGDDHPIKSFMENAVKAKDIFGK